MKFCVKKSHKNPEVFSYTSDLGPWHGDTQNRWAVDINFVWVISVLFIVTPTFDSHDFDL